MINFGITERKKQELELRMQRCNLFEKDIEEKFVRSAGSGGQKVNKSSSCSLSETYSQRVISKVQRAAARDLIVIMPERECVNCLRINCWEKKAQPPKGQKRFESRKTGIDAGPPHNLFDRLAGRIKINCKSGRNMIDFCNMKM
jgi:hypothetical protein